MSLIKQGVCMSVCAAALMLHPSTGRAQTTSPVGDAVPAPGQPSNTSKGTSDPDSRGAVDALVSEIVVTARKRGDENVQKVPLAVTAFGPDQLKAQNFRDLQSLSYGIPNVQLESLGTTKGIASFSIRGLGLNSSIPSIDPTVGVFVDGVYLGITSGVLLDEFDIAGVEVLRGPQGVLFGRNVTGGAVLVRTTAPSDTFKADVHAGIESGPRYTVDGVVTGPLIADRLSGKLGVYYSHDDGYFDQNKSGGTVGEGESTVVRGALRYHFEDKFDNVLRYEHGQYDGDGPAVQNHAVFPRDTFDYYGANKGYSHQNSDQVTLETNYKVGFGHGTITNIAAFRRYEGVSGTDIDSTPETPGVVNGINFGVGGLFELDTYTKQTQYSEELRYAGTFGRFDVTTGLYYFTQRLTYIEQRFLDTNLLVPGLSNLVGGGFGNFSNVGAFAATDAHLTHTLTLNLGVRYTYEDKLASLSRERAAGNVVDGKIGGDFNARTLALTDSNFDVSFDNVSPKVGLQWQPTGDAQVYGFWTEGYRSGGLNLRTTALAVKPAPFGQEKQTTYEIGTKLDFLHHRARLNLDAFTNEIDNIQRAAITPDPVSGIQQIIVNAGNVRINGVEGEASYRLLDNLLISGQFGYLDGKYTDIFVDLNGDKVIDAKDKALKQPRLSPITYGFSAVYDLRIGGMGLLTSRLSFNHRDKSYFSDDNLGYFTASNIVDANLTFRPRGQNVSYSLYATNLTNKVTYGGDTVLPDIPQFGGDGAAGPRPLPTFSPLNRGRVIGVEARVSF